jgi:uncharacterized protein YuzE
MRIRYDEGADAAYIYLVEIAPGGVATTYPLVPFEAGAMINLDYDAEGRLLGIEVMDARSVLPVELLNPC